MYLNVFYRFLMISKAYGIVGNGQSCDLSNDFIKYFSGISHRGTCPQPFVRKFAGPTAHGVSDHALPMFGFYCLIDRAREAAPGTPDPHGPLTGD